VPIAVADGNVHVRMGMLRSAGPLGMSCSGRHVCGRRR
jgi:hypothetical protein